MKNTPLQARRDQAEFGSPKTIAACLALLFLCSAGCGEPRRDLEEWTPADHQPAPEGAGVPEDDEGEGPGVGAALFAVHCATCHGPTGHGDGPGAPPVARVPDLTDPVLAARRSDPDVEVLILSGRGFMPGFERTIPREGIRAIVEYVRTLAPIAAVPEIAPGGEGAPPVEGMEGVEGTEGEVVPPAGHEPAPPDEPAEPEARIPTPPSTDRPPPTVRIPAVPDPPPLGDLHPAEAPAEAAPGAVE